jgi:3-isopropylmalate/(R)-2-methylmalate dehydratase large subunit
MTMSEKTISEKIMSAHSGTDARAGQIVEAEIDYVMANDVTAPLAFQEFEALGCPPIKDKIVLIPDHFVPNKDVASAEQAAEMRRFVQKYALPNYFEIGRGGVCHQVMVDEGFAAPGRLIVGADSHTCTYGGINAFSTGIGSTEAAACFAEGRLWFKVPEAINVKLKGRFNKMISGKDLIIKIITDIGVDGANYKAFEFSGPGVSSITVSDRLTVSNMAIEAGGKAGIFPCDSRTEEFLKGRVRGSYAPVSADPGAHYWKELEYDLGNIDYMVAMPHLPSNGKVASEVDVTIDQAFLGSCTNGRIEDLRQVAKVFAGRHKADSVRVLVVPASARVRLQAEAEGLDRIFIDFGAEWRNAGCSMCLGMNPDQLAPGERSASTSNRNFEGRQGKGGRTHLVSPLVAAATAVRGTLSSVGDIGIVDAPDGSPLAPSGALV